MFHSVVVLRTCGKLVASPTFEPRAAQLVNLATRPYILLIYLTLNNKSGSFASGG